MFKSTATSRPAGVDARTRETILLVDDDPALGRTLSRALESSGYNVVIAETGAEAQAKTEEVAPDLILLDLILPDTDGLVLAMSLNATTDAPIIICSARHDLVDRALGRRLGAADFIAKPFDLDALEVRIARFLRPG